MKYYIISIVAFFAMACNNNEAKQSKEKQSKTTIDSLIKSRIKQHTLTIDYTTNDSYETTDLHIRKLFDWKRAFEQDSVFNTFNYQELSTSFIIVLEAGVNKNIHPETATKRLDVVDKDIADMLGTQQYGIKVFKSIKKLSFRKKNDVKITINRLMY